MIKLANNYTYRYLKDDTKILTICRKKKQNDTLIVDVGFNNNLIINPLRYNYYTEPVTGSDGDTRNTLLAFNSSKICSTWMNNINNNNNHKYSYIKKTDILDIPPASMFENQLESLELTLLDMKSVSADLRMALMVILEINNETYDVYYYNFQQKLKNF